VIETQNKIDKLSAATIYDKLIAGVRNELLESNFWRQVLSCQRFENGLTLFRKKDGN